MPLFSLALAVLYCAPSPDLDVVFLSLSSFRTSLVIYGFLLCRTECAGLWWPYWTAEHRAAASMRAAILMRNRVYMMDSPVTGRWAQRWQMLLAFILVVRDLSSPLSDPSSFSLMGGLVVQSPAAWGVFDEKTPKLCDVSQWWQAFKKNWGVRRLNRDYIH